jgi:4-aminobutyrate aminotransferase-like enzyme
MFGIEQWDVEPDIMTFAKGMANGVPVGGTITRPEVADSVKGLSLSTFGGNPVTCAAALATLEVIESEGLVTNAADRGRQLREGLVSLKDKYPLMGDIRGMGLMQAVEMVGPDKIPSPEAVARLFELTKQNGLLIGKGGLMGNVIRITPALNVTRDQVNEALERLDRSLAQMGL